MHNNKCSQPTGPDVHQPEQEVEANETVEEAGAGTKQILLSQAGITQISPDLS